jgi:inhibitor of KinA sporulation pathway (predicted exonuclease)
MKAKTILVVDVEATCWEEREPPKGQYSEIIEIGCTIMEQSPDDEWETTDSFGILVKPTASYVSEFCENLTGITQQALEDNGVDFSVAMYMLKEVQAGIWASWGNYDYDMMKKECTRHNLQWWKHLPTMHLNVKALFSAKNICKGRGLSRALRQAHMEFEGTPHRGKDDSENVARILKQILKECGG